MNRLQKVAVLTRLVDQLRAQDSWAGETHVQKAVFFLQELLGGSLGFDFFLYKHGPFSFDLRDELTALRADGFLELEPQSPPYGPRFISTAAGREIAVRYPKTLGEENDRIEFVADLFRGKGVKELERLATALYSSVTQGWETSVDSRARFVHEVKPHVTLGEAKEAVQAMDTLRQNVQSRTASL